MKYNYRPDIDGIRAISVLLVLFFHAGIFSIKAGFIGVDIFFVISGFLITTGIKNGLESGNFSFVQFFKKRLWRLQPVFIALLLVTTIFTALTYFPNDFVKFTNSAKWAARFQANKYFSGLDTGYFAEDTSIMPLLHTWSLSIEWQWYLVLPFLMFGFYKILKVKKLAYWVFPLTAVMIGVAFYTLGDRTSPHYYYSFLARIFEMLIGSCLAAVGTKGIDKIPKSIKNIIGSVCLGFIVYTAFDSSVVYQYPNWWAVGVCIAGALLIYIGGDSKDNLITKYLSFKPLVFIGVISYSLYIWHWPVFAFIRNLAIEETWQVTVIALSASLVLACLSFYLVENRFRKNYSAPLYKTILILAVVPYLLILTLDTQNKKNDGFYERFPSSFKNTSKLMAITDAKRINCINNWELYSKKGCTIGGGKSKYQALLIGDSYANHLTSFFNVIGKDADTSVYSVSRSGCFSAPNIYIHDGKGISYYQKCREDTEKFIELINGNKYKYVIVSQFWDTYIEAGAVVNNLSDEKSEMLTKNRMETGLRSLIDTIIKSGAKPVIVQSVFNLNNKKSFSCFKSSLKRRVVCDLSYIQDDWFNQVSVLLKKEYPDLILINLRDLLCTENECAISVDNIPIFRDDNGHISDYMSGQLANDYLKKYGNPLK